MKLKLLLAMLGVSALLTGQDTIRSLVITEAKMDRAEQNYVELTNMGDVPLNLKDFEFGRIDPWTVPPGDGWPEAGQNDNADIERLPDVVLAPGESYVIAVVNDYTEEAYARDVARYEYSQDWPARLTKKEMWELADLQVHVRESTKNDPTDSISIVEGVRELTYNSVLETWSGRDCWFIRHHISPTDSAVVDQVAGLFTDEDGSNTDGGNIEVAGVPEATGRYILVRRFDVKKGNTTFVTGTDLEDSEWIPIPMLTYPGNQYNEFNRAAFWTVGNHLDQKLDETTFKSSTIVVDWDQNTLTVPWGIRNDDSIMSYFDRVPGLAWHYDYAPSFEDSAFVSIRTGDKLTVYACGVTLDKREFTFQVLDPPAGANIVIPKYHISGDQDYLGAWIPYRVTDGVPGMDTISEIPFACRVDSLFAWLEKAPKASWKILWVDGTERPDLKRGDRLEVTAENGSKKEYFLKVQKYRKSRDADLSAITWPDIPENWKGIWGWNGDTIPGFNSGVQQYIIQLPAQVDGPPALVGKLSDDNASLKVSRATSLLSTYEARTTKFTVTAENDTTVKDYTVQISLPAKPTDIQPWKGEPFFSQIVWNEQWANTFMEIVNPGTEPIDMSNYMLCFGWSNDPYGAISSLAGSYNTRYNKYIPGRIWGNSTQWEAQPGIAYTDANVNTTVYPGDVFVIAEIRSKGEADAQYGPGNWPAENEADIHLGIGCPWENPPADQTSLNSWYGVHFYLYKIRNDSVRDGKKPATDPNDFQLLDTWGGEGFDQPTIGGELMEQINGFTRKPEIYDGAPGLAESWGTDAESSEWIKVDQGYFIDLGVGWNLNILRVTDGIGSHYMDPVTIALSTVTSSSLKVSAGYSLDEEILGSRTGSTVDDFLSKLGKKDDGQTLVVKSGGVEITGEELLTHGDSLVVTSANGENTTRYFIEVTPEGTLSHNAVLESDIYEIQLEPPMVGGFEIGTQLREVVEGVTVPEGASFTVIDGHDAFVPLKRLNFDTLYVDVLATDSIFFEVIAEDGETKITYQLMPDSEESDAYVTSDVFRVNQEESTIELIPDGMTAKVFKRNLVPAPGATIVLYDKGGFERTEGLVAIDDILEVTARDGVTTRIYYLGMLIEPGRYLAYVTSKVYVVDQENLVISGIPASTPASEFKTNIRPVKGAMMELQDNTGDEKPDMDPMAGDDLLQVISGNGVNTVFYTIHLGATGTDEMQDGGVRVYPNPSTGILYIEGAAPGQRIRIYSISGMALHEVTVNSTTMEVSLEDQPAGFYFITIGNGDQVQGHFKVIKQ
jgi:hypothetical protein